MTPTELRALLAKATKRPWSDSDYPALFGDGDCIVVLDPHLDGRFMLKTDTELVCAAVNSLDALLDVAEAAATADEKWDCCMSWPRCKKCSRCRLAAAIEKLGSK